MSDGGEPGTDGATPTPSPSGCPDVGLDAPLVRYVCDCREGAAAGCVAGDDSAEGTADDPWRTYGRAASAFNDELDAGETIAFCRGGSFAIEGSRRWVNPRCRAEAPCVVRDYVPAWGGEDLPLPILTAHEDHGFALEDGGGADHEEGYTFLNLDLRSTSGNGNGFFFYNDIDDVLVCGVSIDGFSIGFHASGSNAPEAGSDGENQRLVLSNSRITNCPGQGYLGGCDDCGIEQSYFENNGFGREIFNHNIYIASHSGVSGMFVVGNELYRSAVIEGECRGVSLVGHGRFDDLRIEDNIVREDLGAAGGGCWGIAIDTGYAGEGEAFRDVVIRGNTVIDVGNVSIGVSGCESCLIENNIVVQRQSDFGSHLIAAPDRERDGADLPLTDVVVRNNTLVADTSASVTGIVLGGEGGDHVAVNNVILSEGSGSLTCFDYDLPGSAYALRDHNVCHAAGTLRWTRDAGSLSDWRASSGAGGASSEADPMLTSTSPPFDFTPRAGSPLVDAGHAMSPPEDRNGRARDESPDIGAIER